MINNEIEPFQWFCHEDGSFAVDLEAGEYRKDFFQKYAGEFECDYGNGYDWELFAERYMKKCFPEMTKSIQFDSESELFCIYSGQKEILERFARELKRVTGDPGRKQLVYCGRDWICLVTFILILRRIYSVRIRVTADRLWNLFRSWKRYVKMM